MLFLLWLLKKEESHTQHKLLKILFNISNRYHHPSIIIAFHIYLHHHAATRRMQSLSWVLHRERPAHSALRKSHKLLNILFNISNRYHHQSIIIAFHIYLHHHVEHEEGFEKSELTQPCDGCLGVSHKRKDTGKEVIIPLSPPTHLTFTPLKSFLHLTLHWNCLISFLHRAVCFEITHSISLISFLILVCCFP